MNTKEDCEQVDLNDTKFCYPPVQDILVQDLLIHPDYNKPKFANDIGLVMLAKPAQFNSRKIIKNTN